MAIRTFNSVGGFSVGETPKVVILANSDITTANATLTANLVANIGNIVNDLYVGNIANITGAVFIGNVLTVNNDANINGTLLVSNNSNIGGELLLTGNANVTGTVNAGNLNITTGGLVTSNLIPMLDGNGNVTVSLGNSTNAWKELWISGNAIHLGNVNLTANGTVLTTANANITSNLTANILKVSGSATIDNDLTVSGNLQVSGSTTYINVTTINLKDPLIDIGGSNTGGDTLGYDGKDRGLFLHNFVNSVPVNHFLGWKTSASEFQALTNSSQTDQIVTGTYANFRASTVFANLEGTVNTANQPNITSLGTLTSLKIGNTSSNVYIDTNGNATVGGTFIASNLTYPTSDGNIPNSNEIVAISTDGAGNLSFRTIHTDIISNGTSNVYVENNGNITASVGGNAILEIFPTGANINGNLHVTGDFTVGNLSATDIKLKEVILGNTTIDAGTFITTSTDPDQTIITMLISPLTGSLPSVRAVEFFVKGEEVLGNNYTVASISAIHNGSNVEYAVYGKISIGNAAGTFSVALANGNINLNVTPTSSNRTVWTAQYRTI